jgi:methylated-DNA-protein-cysteine methyltransferase related protein
VKQKNEKNAAKGHDNIYDVIYDMVRAVPRGRVTSYGAIAAAIGAASGARLVGYAMNKCAGVKPVVPAHRVVNRLGLLTGRHHFHPPEKMQQLLEKEGVEIIDNKVVEFDKLFWDPMVELSI